MLTSVLVASLPGLVLASTKATLEYGSLQSLTVLTRTICKPLVVTTSLLNKRIGLYDVRLVLLRSLAPFRNEKAGPAVKDL